MSEGAKLKDNFDEICPSGAVIRYEDGKIKCSVAGIMQDIVLKIEPHTTYRLRK